MAATEETKFTLLDHDVSEVLADTFLESLHSHWERYAMGEWASLTQTFPNLRDFISTLTLEIAPTDPTLREKIAASMVGLLALVGQAKDSEQLETLWASDAIPDEAA